MRDLPVSLKIEKILDIRGQLVFFGSFLKVVDYSGTSRSTLLLKQSKHNFFLDTSFSIIFATACIVFRTLFYIESDSFAK